MLNDLGPIRTFFFALALLACPLLAGAQSSDWHLSDYEGSKAFFTRSAFAHGYMHGYEEGFHKGDLDLQMGRAYRDVKEHEKYRKMCGYRSEYGDRSAFENGYHKGYAVGYVDSYSGRDFRAMQLVNQGRSEASAAASATQKAFDRAFLLGYEAGQKHGLQDGRSSSTEAALDSIQCGANEDCDAYRGGYRLGYSDGYANQQGNRAIFARK